MLEKTIVEVREFQDKDAEEVANLIIRNFREVNVKDYGEDAIEELVKTHDAAWVRQVASFAHMYVFCRGKKSWQLAQFPVFGEVRRKVFCLRYLFYRSIMEKVLAGLLFIH